MSRATRGIVGLLVVALVGWAPAAHAYVCPYAAVQGPLCKYANRARHESLQQAGVLEGSRWAFVTKMTGLVRQADAVVGRGLVGVVQYDSTLRALTAPLAELSGTLTLATALVTDPANTVLTLVDGRQVLVNLAARADSAVGARASGAWLAQTGDTAAFRASPHRGDRLELAVQRAGEAARINDTLTATAAQQQAAASGRAGRVRRYSGADGASDAVLVGAGARLEQLRAAATAEQAEAARYQVDGTRAQQRARALTQQARREAAALLRGRAP